MLVLFAQGVTETDPGINFWWCKFWRCQTLSPNPPPVVFDNLRRYHHNHVRHSPSLFNNSIASWVLRICQRDGGLFCGYSLVCLGCIRCAFVAFIFVFILAWFAAWTGNEQRHKRDWDPRIAGTHRLLSYTNTWRLKNADDFRRVASVLLIASSCKTECFIGEKLNNPEEQKSYCTRSILYKITLKCKINNKITAELW